MDFLAYRERTELHTVPSRQIKDMRRLLKAYILGCRAEAFTDSHFESDYFSIWGIRECC